MYRSRTLNALLALVLALSLIPVAPRPTRADDEARVPIEALLEAGDYVEGEALAVVRGNVEPRTDASAETVAEVDDESVKMAVDAAAAEGNEAGEEGKLRAQAVDADTYTVRHVVDHDRSTEQILRELYEDPNVIVAQPNYINEAPTASGDEPSPASGESGETGTGQTGEQQQPTNDQPAATTKDSETKDSESKNAGSEATTPKDTASKRSDPKPDEAELKPETKAESNKSSEQQSELQPESGQTPATTGLTAQSDPTTGLTAQANPTFNLTDLQWGLSGIPLLTPSASDVSKAYCANVPGWKEGRNNENAPANASGTVCIMDTGMDVTHPDLAGVLYTFSPAQQQKYGCGQHGINVADGDDRDINDLTDYGNHGTHVASDAVAKWDDYGTSGAVNGAKIFCIRVFDRDGAGVRDLALVKGYSWLRKVAKEVNLKAVNLSMGTSVTPQLVDTIMVNELGRCGVNTVYASGNTGSDMDVNSDYGAENTSPYAITVDAADFNGKKTLFTCYGQTSTEVFAPGSHMLNATTSICKPTGESGDSLINNTVFHPERTSAENLVNANDYTSNDTTKPVLAIPSDQDGNPVFDQAWTLGQKSGPGMGYTDERSLTMKTGQLTKIKLSDPYTVMAGGDPAEACTWLAIPLKDGQGAQDVKWFGTRLAFASNSYVSMVVSGLMCKDASGKPVAIGSELALYLTDKSLGTTVPDEYRGLYTTAKTSVQYVSWPSLSFDVSSFVRAAQYLHTLTPAQRTAINTSLTKDPGDVKEPYLWNKNGTNHLLVRLAVPRGENPVITDDTIDLLVDNVAVGGKGAAAGFYGAWNGTSFATPTVTGCLAVIAKDEPESATMSEDELSQEALERKAKLLAAVDYDPDLKPYCRTGGRINLNEQDEFTRKAPIVTKAVGRGGTLTVSGYFFGDQPGTLEVDDQQITPTSWSDNTITAHIAGISNGERLVAVTNADDAVMRLLFSNSSEPETGVPLYEREHVLPMGVPEFEEDLVDVFNSNMVALDGSLYVLASRSQNSIVSMWRYDTAAEEWSSIKPENTLKDRKAELTSLAAANGKVYVYAYAPGDTRSGEENTPRIWCYDPNASENVWTRFDIEGLKKQAVFFSANNQLFVMQSAGEDGSNEFCRINLDAKKVEKASGTVPDISGKIKPTVSTSGNTVYLCSLGEAADKDEKPSIGLDRITYDPEKNSFTSESISESCNKLIGANAVFTSIAAIPDGVALVGSRTDKDSSKGTDTIIVGKDGNATAYKRTATHRAINDPIACYEGGYLYAMGHHNVEPDNLFFRSTQVSDVPGSITYTCTEGDGSTWTKGSGATARFVFKRSEDDSQTFGHFQGITVDGVAVDGTYYTAESGSVVVTVKPEYLETLSTDKHTLAAQFDDAAEARATFTVAAAGSGGNSDGSSGGNTSGTTGQATRTTTQTATPKTSDDTSWTPIVVLVVAASGVAGAAIFLRRRQQ